MAYHPSKLQHSTQQSKINLSLIIYLASLTLSISLRDQMGISAIFTGVQALMRKHSS